MVKANIRITIPNPHYGKDIGVGLLAQILKEAGISRENWISVA
ncbi:MAG: type II toxin-antitoxin system HicA family toxin [Methanotrichaceae archaeon]|nr:type II toxin-antitoxin system HicA family toxin [Methanotrichaceae archaeon]